MSFFSIICCITTYSSSTYAKLPVGYFYAPHNFHNLFTYVLFLHSLLTSIYDVTRITQATRKCLDDANRFVLIAQTFYHVFQWLILTSGWLAWQFFLELMKVPRVESKLNVFCFKITFSTQVRLFHSSLLGKTLFS